MRCERALVEVDPRARLMIEMAVAVHSAHQRRRVADLDLSHMRRDVADGKTDAAIVRTVRLRAVHQLDVVQRHFAGLEQAGHGVRLVHLDRDFLAAREQVVPVESVDVGQLILDVRARYHFHASADRVAFRERDPCRDDVVRLEPPVGRVLVPGNKTWIGRFLDEEVGGPAQDVRPDQVLYRIDNLRVVHQLVGPGEEQVRLVPPVALQRLAGERLVRFERLAVSLRIGRGHDAHRRIETIALERGDGVVR